MKTLDLLQELIGDFPGTVLLVSHDRDFLDRVATLTVAMEGDGRATIYAGGWSDYQAQRGQIVEEAGTKLSPKAVQSSQKGQGSSRKALASLASTEKHRLEGLPAEIDRPDGRNRKN